LVDDLDEARVNIVGFSLGGAGRAGDGAAAGRMPSRGLPLINTLATYRVDDWPQMVRSPSSSGSGASAGHAQHGAAAGGAARFRNPAAEDA